MVNDVLDPEIAAMNSITAALSPLETEAVRRVLRWAIERFQPRPTGNELQFAPAVGATTSASTATALSTPTFLNLADLVDRAQPATGLDRVLTIAYYYQVVMGQDDWDAQTINNEMKHLGYPSTNITRDFDTLQARTPKAVLQTRKEGTTKQARKRYKLTREGIKIVEKLISAAETAV